MWKKLLEARKSNNASWQSAAWQSAAWQSAGK